MRIILYLKKENGKAQKELVKENAKVLKIHENEKGIIVFGNNPQHTEVTVFQNKVLKWQRENGKR